MATRMELTPIKSDFTSTPAYAYDSGYFGSNAKSLHRYSLYDSPSKFSPQKFPDTYSYQDSLSKPSPVRNFLIDDQSHSNVNRQLQFGDSMLENDSNACQSKPIILPFNLCGSGGVYASLGFISPSVHFAQLSRLRVDFLEYLKRRNCERIISDVLSYLPPEDLCRMQCVSKQWRTIVAKDAQANKRRQEYLKNIRVDRENNPRLPLEAQKRYKNLSVFPRYILHDINNNEPEFEPSPKGVINTKFNSFMKEGKNYKYGMLMKCPRCYFASKELHRNKYRCTECDFVFCKKCLSPFRNCQCHPMLNEVPNLIIGSKKCKKNLKRL